MTSHARDVRTLLIANRGEIAARIASVCRSVGVRSVAVYSEPDRDAPFVLAADFAVPIGGSTASESYLDAAKILHAAQVSGADAVHPGYGFLSESPEFAEAVMAAGLVWVGPTPDAMRAMALKVRARHIAQAAGVPVVPGAELAGDVSATALAEAGDSVGYPLLVKASAGGGGRGMRVVSTAEELGEAVASARREAQSAFGDPTVFLERYLERARHIEVQVFGDTLGTVIHLGGRECSVQRRHQKVIEEAPVSRLEPAVRESMESAAVNLARSIGYVGAGTVEFVVSGEGAQQVYYFLEMNTRLQVEHPVTELAYGVPLIEWQLAVAAGKPLPLAQSEVRACAHAIEARLYAEDPARDFAPSTGELSRFEFGHGVRVDSGVAAGSVIGTHYDPMLAKVIAVAPSREAATRVLADALRGAVLHGPITNRDSLVAVLESDEFASGDVTTSFLGERHDLLAPTVASERQQLHLAAAALAAAHVSRELAPVALLAPSGWRNVRAVPQARAFLVGEHAVTVAYSRDRDGSWQVGFTDSPVADIGFATIAWLPAPLRVSASTFDNGDVMVDIEGEQRVRALVSESRDAVVTVHDGLFNSRLTSLPRFSVASDEAHAGGSTTPVPGTITMVSVAVGDVVTVGQTLVVLEAMKMEHRIVSDSDGVVTAVHVNVGQSVDAHAVVVTVEDQ